MWKKRSLKFCLVFFASVFLNGCNQSSEGITSATPSEWLLENVIRLNTSEPGSNYDDLLPLKEIIKDARIVALGEATHGTHEFFQMKHRLIEFLVSEMGFTIFAMEDNFAEAELINEYVQTCEGNPEYLLTGYFDGIWQTQEVVDLLHWMCEYNQMPNIESKVTFAGFDMKEAYIAIEKVNNYISIVDPAYRKELSTTIRCIHDDN